MPVPLPDEPLLAPPSEREVTAISGAYATALADGDGLSDVQRLVLVALTKSMTGFDVDVAALEEVGPRDLAEALARRDESFRVRIVQLLLLGELLAQQISAEVSARVERYAEELCVGDEMLRVVRRLAQGSLGLALVDFQRSGYEGNWSFDEYAGALHTKRALAQAWEENPNDPALAARWAALEHCPPGSLGRRVFEFYDARGFRWPGEPGSAPPLLAQHDWIHVLADYGSTVECEIEVFTFISRANDDPRAFSLQAMVLSLFETGYLMAGAGLFHYDMGHLSQATEAMALRMADAMYRGALCSFKRDLLGVDWFEYAEHPVDDVRRRFRIIPKSQQAWEAGSVNPWERGGLSPFQAEQGRRRAQEAGREYRSYGARP